MTIFGMTVMNVRAQLSTPISNWEELSNIKNDMTAWYHLTCDIEIPAGTQWLPIGKPATWSGSSNNDIVEFQGVLDGKGYSIKGLTIDKTKNDDHFPDAHFNFSALFGRLGFGAIVRNLGLEDVNIAGRDVCGAVGGVMYGQGTTAATGGYNGVTIENVFVTGSITGATEVGGIVGRSNNFPLNTIRNCYVNATVTANGETTTTAPPICAGGIVGCINTGWELLIENVYAAGSVTSEGYAGGILGLANNSNNNGISPPLTIKNSAVVVDNISGKLGSELFYYKNSTTTSPILVTNSYGRNDIDLPSVTGETLSLDVFLTRDFYENTLDWDFDAIWNIEEGVSYPVLFKATKTGLVNPEVNKCWNISTANNSIEVAATQPLFLAVYNIAGKTLFAAQVNGRVSIPANQGIYILKLKSAGIEAVEKVIMK